MNFQCARCLFPVPPNVNWCPSCGFLLIGMINAPDPYYNVHNYDMPTNLSEFSSAHDVRWINQEKQVMMECNNNLFGIPNPHCTYPDQCNPVLNSRFDASSRQRCVSGPNERTPLMTPVNTGMLNVQKDDFNVMNDSYVSSNPPNYWMHENVANQNTINSLVQENNFVRSDASLIQNMQHSEIKRANHKNQNPKTTKTRKWNNSSVSWREQPTSSFNKKPASYYNGKNRQGNSRSECYSSRCNRDGNVYKSKESKQDQTTELSNSVSNIRIEDSSVESESIEITNSPALHLPTEIWLHITSLLPYQSRACLALTCRRLASIVRSKSLWQKIRLHKKENISDTTFRALGARRPNQLHLMYCKGPTLTSRALRYFFSSCANLTHLSFVGCSKGAFDSDAMLLQCVAKCPNLHYLDASYANWIRDQTVITISQTAKRLVTVLLNGAQKITIRAIQHLVKYHHSSLERLELFGCFRLKSDIYEVLGNCTNLRALAFGYLHGLSSIGLLELVGKLPNLASLDLRGTKTVVDNSNLTQLADNCPYLEEFILANMHSELSEHCVVDMLSRLTRLRVLDLCGLDVAGNSTIEALSLHCPHLESLDITCTSVTDDGLKHLVRNPLLSLRNLRISFCKQISTEVLEDVVKCSPMLSKLQVYGFPDVKDWDFLLQHRQQLSVETDKIVNKITQMKLCDTVPGNIRPKESSVTDTIVQN